MKYITEFKTSRSSSLCSNDIKVFKHLIILLFLLNSLSINAQNGTKDLIYSKKVKQFIVLTPDFKNKKVDLAIDNDPGIKVNVPLKSMTTLGMRPNSDHLIILTTFYNPFKNKVVLQDSAFSDDNFASLQKFFDVAKGIVDVLTPENSATPSDSNKVKTAASYTRSDFKAPILSDWKFLYKQGEIDQCNPDFGKILTALAEVDIAYYGDGEVKYQKEVDALLKKLISANNLIQLEQASVELSNFLLKGSELNKTNASNIDLLKGTIKSFQAKNVVVQNPHKVYYCEDFFDYTKDKTQSLIEEVNKQQSLRVTLLEALQSIEQELQIFLENSSSSTALAKSETELVRIGRYPIEEENVHQISVGFKAREVTYKDNKINILDKDNITSNKINLRASHFFVPEFSTGLFYSNLTYSKYDTKQVIDSFIIVDGGTEKYAFIAAAHLNLIMNAFEAPVLPMLQIGIGTAKDRPSLLAGGGLRFLKPKNLSITYGRLWTWKKELNNLTIGDKIDAKSDLENDLKLKLDNKSSYYIGIQYNF